MKYDTYSALSAAVYAPSEAAAREIEKTSRKLDAENPLNGMSRDEFIELLELIVRSQDVAGDSHCESDGPLNLKPGLEALRRNRDVHRIADRPLSWARLAAMKVHPMTAFVHRRMCLELQGAVRR